MTRDQIPGLIAIGLAFAAWLAWVIRGDEATRRRRARRRASRREWDEYRHRRYMRTRPPS